LTDFGIARLVRKTTQLTQSGMLMGTPSYMSPEQWQGKTSVDARADIYALGVMLFEMLSGQLPFMADTPYSMMNMHVNEPPPSIDTLRPDLPPGVAPIIEKALAKDPEDRFQSAGELAQAFKIGLTGQTWVLSPKSEDTPRQLKRPSSPVLDTTRSTPRRPR